METYKQTQLLRGGFGHGQAIACQGTNRTRQCQTGQSHCRAIRSIWGGFAGAGIYPAIGKPDECMETYEQAQLLCRGFGHSQAIACQVHEPDETVQTGPSHRRAVCCVWGGFAGVGIYPAIGKPDKCMETDKSA